ncbi:hypothetical protein ACFPRL_16125 [Pseudoclavibacter helvolus]
MVLSSEAPVEHAERPPTRAIAPTAAAILVKRDMEEGPFNAARKRQPSSKGLEGLARIREQRVSAPIHPDTLRNSPPTGPRTQECCVQIAGHLRAASPIAWPSQEPGSESSHPAWSLPCRGNS